MKTIALPDADVKITSEGLSIGEVARLSGLSVDTLRFYERRGLLLEPAPRDPAGRRRYGADDVAWIRALLMLRETGMSIAHMQELAELSRREGTESERLEVLEAHRLKILTDLERSRRHLAALQKKIDAYRDVLATRVVHEGRTN